MEQNNKEQLQSDFQNRLRKRIEARKINIKEQISMAGNISGTGLLADAYLFKGFLLILQHLLVYLPLVL